MGLSFYHLMTLVRLSAVYTIDVLLVLSPCPQNPFTIFNFFSVTETYFHLILSNYLVVNQYYGADILMEYVIKGNAAILKCSIPSFVADFVRVESWIDEEGSELKASDDYGSNIHTLLGSEIPVSPNPIFIPYTRSRMMW